MLTQATMIARGRSRIRRGGCTFHWKTTHPLNCTIERQIRMDQRDVAADHGDLADDFGAAITPLGGASVIQPSMIQIGGHIESY